MRLSEDIQKSYLLSYLLTDISSKIPSEEHCIAILESARSLLYERPWDQTYKDGFLAFVPTQGIN